MKMNFASAVLEAVLTTGLYYASQYLIDKKYNLDLKKKNTWITDGTVITVGIIQFIAVFWIGMNRLSSLTVIQTAMTLIFFCGLGILAVTDIKSKIIPNKILVLLLLFWTAGVSMLLILQTEFGLTILFESLAGGTIGGIIFLLCYLLSKGQLGAGDVKLVFVMGLYLTGERIIGAVFYGTLICCVYSVLLLIRKKITKKDGVPMTPFLYLGTIITYIIM